MASPGVLRLNGYQVSHVMNLTDVGHLVSDGNDGEDKMEAGSRRTGKTAWDIAEEYTVAFEKDLVALNVVSPTVWCKATDHIPEQIAFIQRIEDRGFTYVTTDGVYFDTSKQDDYGYLGRVDVDGLQGGARVELGGKAQPHRLRPVEVFTKGQSRRSGRATANGMGFPLGTRVSRLAYRMLSDGPQVFGSAV